MPPAFTISPRLLSRAEAITALRERISALQKDARSIDASTAIAGNPLASEQIRAIP